MNKVEKLIAELCPNGMEFRYLGEVGTYTRGISYKKTDELSDRSSHDSIKVLRSNNITLINNTLNFDGVKSIQNTVRIRPDQWLKNNDIIISAASGSQAHVGKVAYVRQHNTDYSFGAFMAVIRTDNTLLNPRFLFHLLTSRSFEKYLQSALQFTTIKNLNARIMKAFRIPVPPLEVQREIVNILDTFSELQAELEAELEARRKQYEYYRDRLLDFDGAPPLTYVKNIIQNTEHWRKSHIFNEGRQLHEKILLLVMFQLWQAAENQPIIIVLPIVVGRQLLWRDPELTQDLSVSGLSQSLFTMVFQ